MDYQGRLKRKIWWKGNTRENWGDGIGYHHLPTRLTLPFITLVVNFKPPCTFWSFCLKRPFIPLLYMHLLSTHWPSPLSPTGLKHHSSGSRRISFSSVKLHWHFWAEVNHWCCVPQHAGYMLVLVLAMCIAVLYMTTPLRGWASLRTGVRLCLCTLGQHGYTGNVCWQEGASIFTWPTVGSQYIFVITKW